MYILTVERKRLALTYLDLLSFEFEKSEQNIYIHPVLEKKEIL